MGFLSLFRRKKKIEPLSGEVKPVKTRYKLGLALSGGGARVFGHIGALRAFAEAGLAFDYIAGTSSGAIVGAAYAAGYTPEQMLEFGLTVKTSDIRNSRLLIIPSRNQNITDALDRLWGADKTFADLKLPFSCVAVDIVEGKEVILNSGNLSRAVTASCCLPVIFNPVELDGKHLVDGGLLNTIPADVVRQMGADYVVSVDLNSARGSGTNRPNKLIEVLKASWNISMQQTALKGTMYSDCVVEPDLGAFSNQSLAFQREMEQAGYEAAKSDIEGIKAAIRK